ncbi:MAG: helix-turn-helix domain-containing protein [Thaumarchaeota archaeon]|nr:helix-turn-helix domain-containing protein [Nitrososphaerota archaeon]
MLKEEFENNLDLIKSGQNFLGILNDIKRRPEDAARELGVPINEINAIISGKKAISSELVGKAVKVWPVNQRDFYIIHDDCPLGVKIMTSEDSKKSSRIMERAGKPYYEYRDTAMSSVAPFRPEWIMELCYADDNDPSNPLAQWNNGHFMHQFTYFIGEVNFYYRTPSGEKKVAIMNTGDSMYITPFVAHTFTTRSEAKQNGLILALTYGSKLTGDIQQELSALSTDLGAEFALDFSSRQKAISSLLRYHVEAANLSLEELSRRTGIQKADLDEFEKGAKTPTNMEIEKIAHALNVNIRDLLPSDKIEDKVIVKHNSEGRKWAYPESTKAYQFVELASTTALPYSKAFEVYVQNANSPDLDLRAGLHQYLYNVGETGVTISWEIEGKTHHQMINPGDSAYVKPFVRHNFRGQGKLLILRIGGKIAGDSQHELSFVGKENAKRAIAETMQWFDPQSKS